MHSDVVIQWNHVQRKDMGPPRLGIPAVIEKPKLFQLSLYPGHATDGKERDDQQNESSAKLTAAGGKPPLEARQKSSLDRQWLGSWVPIFWVIPNPSL